MLQVFRVIVHLRVNYLAHVFLSGKDSAHAVGNFVADTIKGKEWEKYPSSIKRGILLHRAIDQFTDSHPIFKSHVRLLFSEYRHYGRVIVDMFYDHFLAKNWERYHDQALEIFVQEFYSILNVHYDDLPKVIQLRLPVLQRENWLLSYGSVEGLSRILAKMERRTRFSSNLSQSITALERDYLVFESGFFEFFDTLALYCKTHPHGGYYQENTYFEGLKNST